MIEWQCNDWETVGAKLVLTVISFCKLARQLECMTGILEKEYDDAIAASTVPMLQILQTHGKYKCKLSHLGSVSLQCSWKTKHLPYTRENVRVLYAMMDVLLRFIELCT